MSCHEHSWERIYLHPHNQHFKPCNDIVVLLTQDSLNATETKRFLAVDAQFFRPAILLDMPINLPFALTHFTTPRNNQFQSYSILEESLLRDKTHLRKLQLMQSKNVESEASSCSLKSLEWHLSV